MEKQYVLRTWISVVMRVRVSVSVGGQAFACARVAFYLSSTQRAAILSFAASLTPPGFRHYVMNDTISVKKVLNIKCVF